MTGKGARGVPVYGANPKGSELSVIGGPDCFGISVRAAFQVSYAGRRRNWMRPAGAKHARGLNRRDRSKGRLIPASRVAQFRAQALLFAKPQASRE